MSVDDSGDSQLLPPLGLSLAITILQDQLTHQIIFCCTFSFPFLKALFFLHFETNSNNAGYDLLIQHTLLVSAPKI